jgi:DNA-binding XRE family transcriptional regulator
MALASCRQLRAARALAGWTQKDLGQAIGVNERQIRFWEKCIPTNARKRRMLENVFEDAGVEFVSTPTVGVRLTGM